MSFYVYNSRLYNPNSLVSKQTDYANTCLRKITWKVVQIVEFSEQNTYYS